MMLLQAQAEVQGRPGLDSAELDRLAGTRQPKGHAVEVRVYAENPADDHKPTPGLFTDVAFPEGRGTRVDTWLQRGSWVTPFFGKIPRCPAFNKLLSLIPCLDPLLAKVMTYSDTRKDALARMETTLAETVLNGPPTNLEFLEAIVKSSGRVKYQRHFYCTYG